ncbi:MAG: S9 family peptidase [Xanthomonadales bacterium]|jgi:dipeptidyl aminopeptidase/acylaminoacyl peptidase|nr:S9 family peptidase [Xanthomonadales bacterium]
MRQISAFLAFVIFSVLAPFAAADDLRPITHEDVWTMYRVGTPVVGPKGQLAVVSVMEPSYEEDADVSDLWLVRVDGKAVPRRLTSTKESEGGVAWRPDGGAIAFTAKRGDDEASQVYVLDMVGPGEAVRMTNLSTSASSPVWSPDGKKIAFSSRVYPGALDDAANKEEKEARDDRKYDVSAYDIFPIRQWDHWRDDRQTHLFVQEAVAGAIAKDLFAGSKLVTETGFSGTPTRSGSSLKPAWTPDGKSLVFNATTNLHEAAHARVRYHLYSVSAEGGEPEQLTSSMEWSCTGPTFSPSGKQLYCKIGPENEEVYNLDGIGRFDWNGKSELGEPQLVTDGFDRSVSQFEISDNSRTLYLLAADAGRTRIYSLPAKGGKVKALNPDSRGVYAGIQVAGSHLVARWESSAIPAEIVRLDRRGGQEPLSQFNAGRLDGVDNPAFREFWFESSKGRRIHSWLALPPGFDETKRYPLVLQIHGGPFSSSMDSGHVRWSAALLASPGYVVLMTDYTGSVGYGEQFSRNIGGDPLKTPGEELLEAADAAIEQFPFIDGSRQAATGASYGGHLVNWLQGTTSHFKALVGHAGLVDLEGQYSSSDTIYGREIMNGGPPWGDSPVWREQSPATYADQFSTPILLTIGEKDFRVPINQTIAAWSYVQRKQVPGRLLVFHDANHWIMKGEEARYFWQEVHAWLAKHL